LLRAVTDAAEALGIFGSPSFTIGDELYWGDDRAEDALAFAAAPRSPVAAGAPDAGSAAVGSPHP
jgi:hypothetical protein